MKSVDTLKDAIELNSLLTRNKMIKNKVILVTGCFGFVAQHLINKLLLNKNIVVGIYNRKYQMEIFDNKIFKKNKKFIVFKGDIRNKLLLISSKII